MEVTGAPLNTMKGTEMAQDEQAVIEGTTGASSDEGAMLTEDNEIEQLRAKIAESEEDVGRLDFIQQSTKGYGYGWVFRESTMQRGMRLHETSSGIATADVRQAIDQAIAKEKSDDL